MSIKSKIFVLLFFFANYSFGQRLTEFKELFSLIQSGKKKVLTSSNNSLGELWKIDSANFSIEKYSFQQVNGIAPKFDEKRSVNTYEKYQFFRDGRIAHILFIHYPEISVTPQTFSPDTSNTDTSIFIYSYETGKFQPYNCIAYSLKSGERIKYKTEIFGYDQNGLLILFLEDEGRRQTHYLYNQYGQLVEERFMGYVIKYYYDERGNMVKKTCGDRSTVFKYNHDQMLESYTSQNRNEAETWKKYVYE